MRVLDGNALGFAVAGLLESKFALSVSAKCADEENYEKADREESILPHEVRMRSAAGRSKENHGSVTCYLT